MKILEKKTKTTEALDILTDTKISTIDAVRKFIQLSRRWKPVSQAFIGIVGLNIRSYKEDRDALLRWKDDGGR